MLAADASRTAGPLYAGGAVPVAAEAKDVYPYPYGPQDRVVSEFDRFRVEGVPERRSAARSRT